MVLSKFFFPARSPPPFPASLVICQRAGFDLIAVNEAVTVARRHLVRIPAAWYRACGNVAFFIANVPPASQWACCTGCAVTSGVDACPTTAR
jgi:hypothetical protein